MSTVTKVMPFEDRVALLLQDIGIYPLAETERAVLQSYQDRKIVWGNKYQNETVEQIGLRTYGLKHWRDTITLR